MPVLEPHHACWLLHGFGAMFCPYSMHTLPLVMSVIDMVSCDFNSCIRYDVFLALQWPPFFHFTVKKIPIGCHQPWHWFDDFNIILYYTLVVALFLVVFQVWSIRWLYSLVNRKFIFIHSKLFLLVFWFFPWVSSPSFTICNIPFVSLESYLTWSGMNL